MDIVLSSPITVEKIERHVERCFDRYDAALMAGRLDQPEYDLLARKLTKWADDQYNKIGS